MDIIKVENGQNSKIYIYNKSKKVDKRLKKCPECNQVWEIVNGDLFHYHIPTIGKKPEVCPECKNNKSAKE